MKVYFWTKLERTTGRVGSWKPGLATDAQATGLFGDSVEGVYFSTVLSGQKEHDIRQRFQAEVSWLAMECGFDKCTVVIISETDYFAFTRKYAEARLEAMGVRKAAIEGIKTNVRGWVDEVCSQCETADELREAIELIEQLTANFKEAK
jgi:hypothetical protein